MDYSAYEKFMSSKIENRNFEKEIFMTAFRKFDKNGDGFIQKDELKSILCSSKDDPPTEDEVNDTFREADLDNDGKICYEGNVLGIFEVAYMAMSDIGTCSWCKWILDILCRFISC